MTATKDAYTVKLPRRMRQHISDLAKERGISAPQWIECAIDDAITKALAEQHPEMPSAFGPMDSMPPTKAQRAAEQAEEAMALLAELCRKAETTNPKLLLFSVRMGHSVRDYTEWATYNVRKLPSSEVRLLSKLTDEQIAEVAALLESEQERSARPS